MDEQGFLNKIKENTPTSCTHLIKGSHKNCQSTQKFNDLSEKIA